MNKYEEALNDIFVDYDGLLKYWKSSLPSYEYEELNKQVNENISALRELIDNYSVSERALDKASEIVSKDSSREERSFHCISVEDARDYFLQKAKEELESEKENGK